MHKFKTKTGLIMYFLKGAKRYFAFSACFALLVTLLDMINPRVISFAVDCVIGDRSVPAGGIARWLTDRAGGIGVLKSSTWLLALAAALIGAAAALCRYAFRSCNARGAQTLVRRMRDELFGHILYLPYSWFFANAAGDIIQRCTSDVQTIIRFISEQMTTLVRTVMMLIMGMIFMMRISMQAALTNAAFIPVVLGYSLYFHKKIASAFQKADEEEGRLSAIAQENLTGVRVVRAFGREMYERNRFESQNEYYTGFWIHLHRLLSIFWSSSDVLTGLQMLCVTVLCTVLCVKGQMTAGNMIAVLSYTVMLSWPIRVLGRVIAQMSKAGISIERLRDIMNAQPEQDREDTRTVPMDRDIRFEHVSFAYPAQGEDRQDQGKRVLDDVSFEIRAGQTIGILGGTGSGKTTLMYLLERLYELPEENGRITIGGTDIRKIPLSYLRQNVGIVLQEPFLFSRTLEENIGIAAVLQEDSAGSPEDMTPEQKKDPAPEIKEAAAAAAIDSAIESFTDGYQTFVGERGVTLSGGQKQRTAIAQLLIRHTPVMIFDDSLSAVDAETDVKIRKSLQDYKKDTTLILIAHRITTLMNADQIIVLDGGRLVQRGTHEELVKEEGLYRKIFLLQSAGEDPVH